MFQLGENEPEEFTNSLPATVEFKNPVLMAQLAPTHSAETRPEARVGGK